MFIILHDSTTQDSRGGGFRSRLGVNLLGAEDLGLKASFTNWMNKMGCDMSDNTLRKPFPPSGN